ncbi:MAG: TolC family protein, partial [Candidatus Firestonebacteria bacterium]
NKQAAVLVEQAGAYLLPQLSLKGGYSLQQAGSGSVDALTTALNLNQVLYDGGQLSYTLDKLKTLQRVKGFQLAAAKLELYASVAGSFYAVLAAEKDRFNTETVIKQTKEMLAELERRKAIGKTKYSEVLMAQVQLASLEADLEGITRNILSSREAFALLTGLSRDSALEEENKNEEAVKELEYYLAASAKRPDLAALQAEMEALNYESSVQASYGLPVFSLNGNYYPLRTGSSSGVNWDAGLTLNFRLFDWGAAGAGLQEAQSKAKEAGLNLSLKKREAEKEVRSAYGSLQSLLLQIKKFELAVDLSEKNYLEQKKDYEFSLVTNLEVLQALNSLQSSKKALDRFRLEALTARAQLLAVSNLAPIN